MHSSKRPFQLRATVALLIALPFLWCAPAPAYNSGTHQDIVDFAYQIMRAATLTTAHGPIYPDYRVGPGAAASPEWADFIQAMSVAVEFWRNQVALGQKLPYSGCNEQGQPDPDAFLLKDQCPNPSEANPPAGGIFTVVDKVRQLKDAQLVSETDPSPFGGVPPLYHRDYTGRILGFWSGDVDSLVDDTSLGFRFTPFPGSSGGSMKDLFDGLAGDGAGFVLLALLCIYQVAIVGDDACLELALQLLDLLGLGDELAGLLPGIGGNFMDSNVTGNWHFIQMHGQDADFDDRPGYWIEEAGPGLGAIDEAFMIFSDFTQMYLVYDDSAGVKKYQIEYQALGDDGHPYTVPRDEEEWEYPTFGHLVFEPVDNLAFYGWREWRKHQTLIGFGYVLHALGDAAEPQHVSGTSGWGHRPFEDVTSDRWLWLRAIRFPGDSYLTNQEALNDQPQPGTVPFAFQKGVADLILQKAFEYRAFILAWRTTHPDQAKDTPIRDLVTLLAQQTHDYCFAEYAQSGWPFYDVASVNYFLPGQEGESKEAYLNNPANDNLTQGLIIRSVAATIAVLTSAPEWFTP